MPDALWGFPVVAVDGPAPEMTVKFGPIEAMHDFIVPCDAEGRIWVDDFTYITSEGLQKAVEEYGGPVRVTIRPIPW